MIGVCSVKEPLFVHTVDQTTPTGAAYVHTLCGRLAWIRKTPLSPPVTSWLVYREVNCMACIAAESE
jgi:3-deoxy-D-manno-octulosonic-acid transferase